jgi:hypothetical protein
VFLVVILLLPRGIIPSVGDLIRRLTSRRAVGPSDTASSSSDTHAVAGVQSP